MDDQHAEARKQAAFGPLALKDPNSVEYAWQMTSRLQRLYQLWKLREQDWREALEQAEQHRIYERIPPEKPYGSLRDLLLAEIGADIEDIDGE